MDLFLTTTTPLVCHSLLVSVMWIRLKSGETIELLDEWLTLSPWLALLHKTSEPVSEIHRILKQQGTNKATRNEIIQVLHDFHETRASLDTGGEPVTLKYLLQHHGADILAYMKETRPQLTTSVEIEEALNCLFQAASSQLDDQTVVFNFVEDHILLWVIEFLRIQSPKRGLDMFNEVIAQEYGTPPSTPLESVVHRDLLPYVEFLHRIPDHESADVARAAIQMQIDPLCRLMAIRFARQIKNADPEQLKHLFPVEDSARSGAWNKFKAIVSGQPWVDFIAQAESSLHRVESASPMTRPASPPRRYRITSVSKPKPSPPLDLMSVDDDRSEPSDP